MYSIAHAKGFVILTTVVLLSFACIIFTMRMAKNQLLDDEIEANYYRTNEAFVNAESGINDALSKINQSTSLLNSLPLTYSSQDNMYSVDIKRLTQYKINLVASGTSHDGSAQKKIQVQVFDERSFDIPKSPFSSNGKVNFNGAATINDGCEGLPEAQCTLPENIAAYSIITSPVNEIVQTTSCTGSALGKDQIESRVLYSNSIRTLSIKSESEWPNTIPENSVFYGLPITHDFQPQTLFQSTFGVSRNKGLNALQNATDVLFVDLTEKGAIDCGEQLLAAGDDATTIYIKGDCYITGNNDSSLTIGSVEHPKLVFIEGGSFITDQSQGISVIGMLYLLPATQQTINTDGELVTDVENVIDLSGLRVNGAMLSDYACSDNLTDQGNSSTSAHLFVRYDKAVLNQLYKLRGSVAVASDYSLVSGSWKDFE